MNKPPFTFFLVRDPKIHHVTDAPIVAVRQGEQGYYPVYPGLAFDGVQDKVDSLNQGVLSKEVAESALAASVFGWDTPAAQAANEYAARHQGG